MNVNEIDPSFIDKDQDKVMQREKSNSRKPTITLYHLHKLKKMRAAKDLENLMRGDFLEIIYGAAGEEQTPGGGGI
jgi:hypothetical protein